MEHLHPRSVRIQRPHVACSMLAAAVALTSGCRRSPTHDEPAQAAAPTAVTPADARAGSSASGAAEASARVAGTCALTPLALRLPAPARLVAIGDLHGDLA